MQKYGDNKNKHMKAVAEVMYENAKALNLNPEIAYVIGLLHDVGYIAIDKDTPKEEKISHAQEGARILEEIGITGDNLDAVRYHGVNGYKMIEDGKTSRISPMLMLLQYGDMSVDKYGEKVGFAKRIMDIGKRYGMDSIAYKNAIETVNFLNEVLELRLEGNKPYINPMNAEQFFDKVLDIESRLMEKRHEEEIER